jgi:hypothetical protein
LNELRALSADNARLETEVMTSRRDLDSMLDLLRRKERQFTEERKVLTKKNKELSEIFDLFTERRRRRTPSMTSQYYYSTDDAWTQTDDVILMSAAIDIGQVRVITSVIVALTIMLNNKHIIHECRQHYSREIQSCCDVCILKTK